MPLSQPFRSKTKTNRELLVCIFLATCIIALRFDWFTGCTVSFVIGAGSN